MSLDFRFISVPNPGDAAAQKAQRRSARSHTAKQQHAKARRLRTEEFQARKKARSNPKHDGDDTDPPEPPQSLSLVLSSDRRDPFASFASPLTPVEHFLLDHFVKAVIPAMRCEDSMISHIELMTRSWVPFALSDACLMRTLFLTACRHLCCCHQDASQPEDWQRFEQLAVQYKVSCVQEVRNALSVLEPPYSPSLVGAVVMLAFDEAG